MPKIKVKIEVEVPSCRYCVHRYGNTCKLFDRELTSHGNVGDVDWGYIRCDAFLIAREQDAEDKG